MLSFAVYVDGKLLDKLDLAGAYLVGSDEVPLRADLEFAKGIVHCTKKAPGSAGLALPWEIAGFGKVLVETVRLLERDAPYILQVELARGRLLRIAQKAEDWGLIGYEGTEEISAEVMRGRAMLIAALKADTPAEAASRGAEALGIAVKASEALTAFHAEIFVDRRKQTGGFGRRVFGTYVHLKKPTTAQVKRLASGFDFVTLPLVWRDIEPTEQAFDFKALDVWVEALAKQRVPIKGSSLLSFAEHAVPDWLYIWEHDFDTLRDLAFEHVRRVVNRYGQYIHVWDVISGIHADNCFSFNFEQLMELTRMAAAQVKQAAPRATTIVDMVAPWGEYYARNQRTIPPLLYADMVVQSGVDFDSFGLRFQFGPARDGLFVRDMFQISSMLDALSKLGKPVHLTAVGVPSEVAPDDFDGDSGEPVVNDGGVWQAPWSEAVQAEWLADFFRIALSKPFVETVCWHSLADHAKQVVPHGGLLGENVQPKAAYHRLMKIRSDVLGGKPT